MARWDRAGTPAVYDSAVASVRTPRVPFVAETWTRADGHRVAAHTAPPPFRNGNRTAMSTWPSFVLRHRPCNPRTAGGERNEGRSGVDRGARGDGGGGGRERRGVGRRGGPRSGGGEDAVPIFLRRERRPG